jgi:hypothetical protein
VILDFSTHAAEGGLIVVVAKTAEGVAFCDNLGLPRQAGNL